jgi:hypothetical protein
MPDDLELPGVYKWNQALSKARAAQDILVGCKRESLESWEEVGCRGLACLNER